MLNISTPNRPGDGRRYVRSPGAALNTYGTVVKKWKYDGENLRQIQPPVLKRKRRNLIQSKRWLQIKNGPNTCQLNNSSRIQIYNLYYTNIFLIFLILFLASGMVFCLMSPYISFGWDRNGSWWTTVMDVGNGRNFSFYPIGDIVSFRALY